MVYIMHCVKRSQTSNRDEMAIGRMHNYMYLTITVTTALNSDMIGSGSLAGLAFDWPRPGTQKDFDR